MKETLGVIEVSDLMTDNKWGQKGRIEKKISKEKDRRLVATTNSTNHTSS